MDDLEFRTSIEKLLVSKGYWGKYDWLNNATANSIMVEELEKRIRKHPILWRVFFKIH